MTQAVIEEVEKDPAHSHGPAFIKDQLRLKMLFAPRYVLSILHGQLLRDPGFRDLIRKIMVEQYPDGFDVRFPGRKNHRVVRVPLHASGPYFEISSDGHEKLAPSALRMGGVGFSIYGFKDKFTDYIVFLKIFPDVRSSGAGGHIFLDFVEDTGCMWPFFEPLTTLMTCNQSSQSNSRQTKVPRLDGHTHSWQHYGMFHSIFSYFLLM